ncbi:hypothetical protein [Nostoc sp. C117]
MSNDKLLAIAITSYAIRISLLCQGNACPKVDIYRIFKLKL